jgi:hypothetical protein
MHFVQLGIFIYGCTLLCYYYTDLYTYRNMYYVMFIDNLEINYFKLAFA